jgi:hypothetical protein
MALKRMTDTRPSLHKDVVMSRRAWMSCEAFDVNLGGTASSADLGGSSK